jgi:predicted glutamine amidotransferase
VCRLYGFLATEATKVECSLVYAQNALMVQSRSDRGGVSHANGWGVCTYQAGRPQVTRQAWAAYHGEHFRRAAGRAYSTAVLAHVRRATVGEISLVNTHPFTDGAWSFAHNGTLPGFASLRPSMLGAMTTRHRAALEGGTDSEHLFRLILSLRDQGAPMVAAVRRAVRQVRVWCDEWAPDEPLGLNVLLSDGRRLIGVRWGRPLCFVAREGVHDCEICGFPHVDHDPEVDYRAVVVASEPITRSEAWTTIADGSLVTATAAAGLQVESIGATAFRPTPETVR